MNTEVVPIEWKAAVGSTGEGALADVEVFELYVERSPETGAWRWVVYETLWKGDQPCLIERISGVGQTERHAKLKAERWFRMWCKDMAEVEAAIGEWIGETYALRGTLRHDHLVAFADRLIEQWDGEPPLPEYLKLGRAEYADFIEYCLLPVDFMERHRG